jgi:hypothetical protein
MSYIHRYNPTIVYIELADYIEEVPQYLEWLILVKEPSEEFISKYPNLKIAVTGTVAGIPRLLLMGEPIKRAIELAAYHTHLQNDNCALIPPKITFYNLNEDKDAKRAIPEESPVTNTAIIAPVEPKQSPKRPSFYIGATGGNIITIINKKRIPIKIIYGYDSYTVDTTDAEHTLSLINRRRLFISCSDGVIVNRCLMTGCVITIV